MIAGPIEKNLGFVLEPAESARMDHPISISLVFRSPFRGRFLVLAATGLSAELRVGREILFFEIFEFLAGPGHGLGRKPKCEIRSPNLQ